MLSKLRHCHLVSLIGYCNEGKEMILVYEYMPHGTLEDHLHKLPTSLSWVQRLKICIGAARGLHYLHTGTGIELGVIHRDVKSSNILLHDSWAAKVSDFGLSKIGPVNQPSTYVKTLVKGTFGYLDPHYFKTGRLSRRSDVYAFGVVLFEVLCRKRAMDTSLHEEGLVGWAQDSVKKGRLKHIVDPSLSGQISPKCLEEFARTADRCLHGHPKQRPTMAEVVVSLESVLALQEKTHDSPQPAGRTIFGRMALMLPSCPSKANNSAHGDAEVSRDSESNSTSTSHTVRPNKDMFLTNRDGPTDHRNPSPIVKEFKFDDLKKATRNFCTGRLLGEGGFGKVFLGWVDMNTCTPSSPGVGTAVAVKRLCQECIQGYSEGLKKLYSLGLLSHPNVISLLGYSSVRNDRLLVYEYMQNGRFDHHLFRNAKVTAAPLPWGTRLNIMIGVARGLAFLHSSKYFIYHGFKSSSILLDQEFNGKLGDFRLPVCRIEIGYGAPEYIKTGQLSRKSDIFSFGVVVLECLTGLRSVDSQRPVEQYSLVGWAMPFLQNKMELMKIMDPRLEQNYPLEGAFQCAALAIRCVAYQPRTRPSSEEVLQRLERINAISM